MLRLALVAVVVLLAAGGGYAIGAAGGDRAIKRYVVGGSTDDDPTHDKWVTAECPEGSTVVSGGGRAPRPGDTRRRRLLVGTIRGPRRPGLVGRGAGHPPRH